MEYYIIFQHLDFQWYRHLYLVRQTGELHVSWLQEILENRNDVIYAVLADPRDHCCLVSLVPRLFFDAAHLKQRSQGQWRLSRYNINDPQSDYTNLLFPPDFPLHPCSRYPPALELANERHSSLSIRFRNQRSPYIEISACLSAEMVLIYCYTQTQSSKLLMYHQWYDT